MLRMLVPINIVILWFLECVERSQALSMHLGTWLLAQEFSCTGFGSSFCSWCFHNLAHDFSSIRFQFWSPDENQKTVMFCLDLNGGEKKLLYIAMRLEYWFQPITEIHQNIHIHVLHLYFAKSVVTICISAAAPELVLTVSWIYQLIYSKMLSNRCVHGMNSTPSEVGVSFRRNAYFWKKWWFRLDETHNFIFLHVLVPPSTSQIVHGEMVSNLVIFLLQVPPAEIWRLNFLLIFNVVFNVFLYFRHPKLQNS